MEYSVVKYGGENMDEVIAGLKKTVNKLIDEGWIPLGGVQIFNIKDRRMAVQSIVKY